MSSENEVKMGADGGEIGAGSSLAATTTTPIDPIAATTAATTTVVTPVTTDVTTITATTASEPSQPSSPPHQQPALTHSNTTTPVSTTTTTPVSTNVTSPTPDSSDSKLLGWGKPVNDVRTLGVMSVGQQSPQYKMEHKHRGKALILAYEHYVRGGPSSRPCARHDAEITKSAFKLLGFQIEEYWNLDKEQFRFVLERASKHDYSNSDGLAVLFMSHGGLYGKDDKYSKANKEFIWTYDDKVDTTELWKYFTAGKCPSLAGKPKMFFIQACRGEETDKGVYLKRPKGLAVSTDGISRSKEEEYVIPQHADMLFMWASYPGMFAFRSNNFGIRGSVFLHFLSKVLEEDSRYYDLTTMLLRVTREVATQYESYVPDNTSLNENKQIPYTVSTLMRKVNFFQRKPTEL